MRNTLIIFAVPILLFGGSIWWSKSLQKSDPNIISRNGLHWHPELTIYVKGEKIEIPQNLGLGTVHLPVHTHEDLPIIHLEFQNLVRKQDITLGQFFKSWGKDINSLGINVNMTVNGVENTELDNYEMKDGDKIELKYE
ncbi:MAG TPA: hypothetical protein VJJ48_00860 [Candidatus Paceibacterota bacterium]